jgi:transcriptional regulator with XRE-family HTH domain
MKGRALFAWNLRRIRIERRISQERLAADAGVDRAYISELERKKGNATLDFVDKVAACLEVPVLEFFREPEPGAKKPRSMAGGRPRSRSRRS